MTKPDPVFKTEAELCAAFIEWATRNGYRCYPETADFDRFIEEAAQESAPPMPCRGCGEHHEPPECGQEKNHD